MSESEALPTVRCLGHRGGFVDIRDLGRDDLVVLAQRTYVKDEWTPDDLRILRTCWDEFEKRGGENAVMFFRPAFFGVLKFHEIEACEVDEEFIRMLEPSEIARDYREIIRKLQGAACETKECR